MQTKSTTRTNLVTLVGMCTAALVLATQALAAPEQIDCNSTESLDIRATAWNIVDDWSDFEDYVEDRTSYNIKSCLKNRLDYNGKVKCLSSYKSWLGKAWPTAKKMKVSQDFRNILASLGGSSAQPNRRSCWAYMMAHEFSHTCDRGETAADAIGEAAFDYWKDRFSVSSSHDFLDCKTIP